MSEAERVPDPEEVQQAIDAANGNEVNTESSDSDSEENMWGDFAQEFDSEDEESSSQILKEEVSEEVPSEEVGQPAEKEEPPATPAAVEEQQAPVEVPPAVEPQQPETPTQPEPVQQTPPEQQVSPEERIRQRQEARAQAVDELARNFSFSDEDSTTLLSDPGAFIPKFRAELFMDVFDATVQAVTQAVPNLVQNMNKETVARDQSENAFYDANPLLDKTQHAATVNRLANAYLNAVPNATPEQMIKEVGVQAMFLLGIDPTKAQQQQQQNTPPPEQKQQPYTPAGAGTVSTPASNNDDGNIWATIAEDLEEDD